MNLDAIYRKLKLRKLEACPQCEIGLPGCKVTAIDIHHRAGKEGIRLIIYEWFFSACRPCHNIVTAKSKEAIAAGHSLMRGCKEVTDRFWWIKDHLEEYIESLKL